MMNNVGGPAILLVVLYVAWPLFIIWASIAAVSALKRIAEATERLADGKAPQGSSRGAARDKSDDPAYKYIPK